MGAPANFVWLPLLLLAMIMPAASVVTVQTNDTSSSRSQYESSSTSSPQSSTTTSTSPSPIAAAAVEDKVAGGQPAQKSSIAGPYDEIDVLAATSGGAGQPKSGQTTRIYTTGEVNDDFWLKHLGDDFKHAIHLQVGNTNDDYNRIINQTNNGVHEEVHHEYLPGADRPSNAQQPEHNHYYHDYQQQQKQQEQQQKQHQQQQQQQSGHDAGYGQSNLISQLNLDGEGMALKENYMRQQEQPYAHGYGQQQQHSANYNSRQRNLYNTDTHTYPHIQHNTYNTHNTHNTHDTHIHTRTQSSKSRHDLRHRYKPNNNNVQPPPASPPSSIINSSEDTLHTAQTQTAPQSAQSQSSSSSFDSSQLPFKSPFNDYGNRATRDLTYLLYKRGL